MACFLAPMSLGVITTLTRKKIPYKYHLDWLNYMLWGGVLALIVEHIFHQEVVLYPPFFTKGLKEMLPEIIMVGIPMSLAIVLVWITMVVINIIFREKRVYKTSV